MSELWTSPYLGIALSILAFWAGEKLQKKLKSPFCNPLLIAILIIVIILLVFDIPYDSYNEGGAVINMFLAPATACLAVSIYTKRRILKESWLPILVGCTVGCLASMGSVLVMCHLFGLDEAMTASLTPKSVTTAIAISDPGDQKGYKAFPIGFDYSNREWFLQPMRTGKLHITNVHQSQVTGQLIITVSTVITDANDEIIGVLGADIQLEEIIRRAESLEAEVPNSEEE